MELAAQSFKVWAYCPQCPVGKFPRSTLSPPFLTHSIAEFLEETATEGRFQRWDLPSFPGQGSSGCSLCEGYDAKPLLTPKVAQSHHIIVRLQRHSHILKSIPVQTLSLASKIGFEVLRVETKQSPFAQGLCLRTIWRLEHMTTWSHSIGDCKLEFRDVRRAFRI